jgi:polyhydroxyalkanoate synthesis regulator phasin
MFELFEKAALSAIGAAAMTQKKGEELLQELRSQYKMSEAEGKALLERIQEIGRVGRERTAEMAEAEVKRALDRWGLVSREEFEKLERRVKMLEAQQSSEEEPGTEC